MSDYKCSRCGAEGVKLWRQWNTLADHIKLMCIDCTCKDQKKSISVDPDGYHDSHYGRECIIGSMCPARPVDDTFWGHASGPPESVEWWVSLPLRAAPPSKEE